MIYSKLSIPFQDKVNQPSCPNQENTQNKDKISSYNHNEKVVGSNSMASNVYSAYEDLPDFFKDSTDFQNLFNDLQSQIKEDADWKIQFDVIENLRILNKFHPKEVGKYLHQFPAFLQRCIDNLRTNLSKNTLLLIKEVFMNFREVRPSEELLYFILPKVIEKGTSEKNFLKNEAKGALCALSKSGCCDPVVKILCERTFDKNPNISELAFQTLSETVKEAKENLMGSISSGPLELLFSTIAKTINGKRAVSKRTAEELCIELRGTLPTIESDLEDYLKSELKMVDSEAKVIVKAMENKKKMVVKNNFSSFLKEKRLQKGMSSKEENIIEENNQMNEDEI